MKKLLSLLLMLSLSAFTSVVAANVASVTAGGETTSYESLSEAFAAAQNPTESTVKLLADVTLDADQYFVFTKGNVTFDLNGKTLTGNISYSYNYAKTYVSGILIVNGGSVTVLDSSSAKNGSITNDNTNGGALYILKGALTVEEVIVFTPYYALISRGGTCVVNGGTFTCSNSATMWSNSSTITLYGGTYTNTSSSSRPFNIQNGKFVIGEGYCFVDESNRFYEGEISNVNTISRSGHICVKYPQADTDLAEVTISSDKTRYKNLRQAFDEAQKASSATVTLLCDVTLEENDCAACINGGKVTLDLNGKTITANVGSYYKKIYGLNTTVTGVISVAGGELIIEDKTSEPGGIVNNSSNGTVLYMKWDTSATINNGTFWGNDAIYSHGSLTINGGDFTAPHYALEVVGCSVYSSGSTTNYHSYLNVNGGTFTSGERTLTVGQDGEATLSGGTFGGDDYVLFDAGGRIMVAEGYVYHADGSDDWEGRVSERLKYGGTVVLKSSLPTNVKAAKVKKSQKAIKKCIRGKIVIENDGVTYDLSGQRL